MNTNPVVAIPFDNALPVSLYTEDTTPPELVRYDLDLDTGLLTLEFTETVNASSFNLSEVIIQNESSLLSYISIYNSSIRFEDSVFLYVQFGFDFFNELKRLDDLATTPNNTFLSFTSDALLDMNNNYVVAIENTSSRAVLNFTPDTNSPSLVAFDLDMDSGVITLSFNETIRVSTIATSFISLSQYPYTVAENASGVGPVTVSGSGASASGFDVSGSGLGSVMGLLDSTVDFYMLTGGEIQLENSHIVIINITLFDLNQIKKLRGLATSRDNTYILLTSQALNDMYNNSIVPIEEGHGLQVSSFVKDTTPPNVDMYHLDMNLGLLTILFTETVDTRTLVIGDRIAFYNSSDFMSSSSYILVDSTSTSGDGPLIVIDLSPSDLNQLKFIRDLASNQLNTFLFLNATVLDMVGNVVTPLYMGQNETRPADNFTADTTPPELLQYDLDVDSGRLYLTFSEVVDEINATAFTFQSQQNETITVSVFTIQQNETEQNETAANETATYIQQSEINVTAISYTLTGFRDIIGLHSTS